MPGDPVPADFVADTVDGGMVSTADLTGPDVLVLFVDGSCTTCFDAVGLLKERHAAGADTVRPIAVVIGQPEERTPLVAELAPIARVVEETSHTALPSRFGVRGFPPRWWSAAGWCGRPPIGSTR